MKFIGIVETLMIRINHHHHLIFNRSEGKIDRFNSQMTNSTVFPIQSDQHKCWILLPTMHSFAR